MTSDCEKIDCRTNMTTQTMSVIVTLTSTSYKQKATKHNKVEIKKIPIDWLTELWFYVFSFLCCLKTTADICWFCGVGFNFWERHHQNELFFVHCPETQNNQSINQQVMSLLQPLSPERWLIHIDCSLCKHKDVSVITCMTNYAKARWQWSSLCREQFLSILA